MSALSDQSPSRRRLLLASDRSDRSSELADILRSVGNVDTVATTEIPPFPNGRFSGVVVDINLRSPESVQTVRNRLRADVYSDMPRLFVLAEALHHATIRRGHSARPTPFRGRSMPMPSCSASTPRSRIPQALTRPTAARP